MSWLFCILYIVVFNLVAGAAIKYFESHVNQLLCIIVIFLFGFAVFVIHQSLFP